MKYLLAVFLLFSFELQARSNVSILASDNIYKYMVEAADIFRDNSSYEKPNIQISNASKGTLFFCAGQGENFFDIMAISRKLTNGELKKCSKNDVGAVIEIMIGHDAIVVATSEEGRRINLKPKHLFLAMARYVPKDGELVENFYQNWKEISFFLPNQPIKIYAEGPGSYNFDSIAELILVKECEEHPEYAEIYPDKNKRMAICREIRKDKVYDEIRRNSVKRVLEIDEEAVVLTDMDNYDKNISQMVTSKISGIYPDFSEITSSKYPLTRPIYIYIKKNHLNIISSLRPFIKELVSDRALGEDGYLSYKGLVPLNSEELLKATAQASSL